MTTPNNDPYGSPEVPAYNSQNFDAGFNDQYLASGVDPVAKNGLALAGLIVSVIAVVALISFIGTALAWAPAIVGLILSIIGLVKAKKFAPGNARKGMAVGGLILSILVLVISVVLLFVVFYFAGDAITECSHLTNPQEQQQCIMDNLEQKQRELS
ncbi:hypothetical protein P4N68_09715 [Corynebacterium felinum]|uniref:Preprotein translocase subunit SecE n=1 Tax=Corynebacterium felinum TaxID=131318 RepID=A0ABU2BEN7_9CORY|nr:hypothetical protein [Corynebacterium felinum]MDF5821353.1 hypothetical protein [Corynebacterium felinum]MDR7355849.1 preprotein translocase subunit SecE [Corynebacterium felinum]WJY95193.1 hypothetical protein CFELI_07935 [Corynebacterium felinum]